MQLLELKKATYEHLLTIVIQKINTAEEEIESARTSIVEDTKSSAGDKYETGREMMQAELTRNNVNLSKALTLKKELVRLNLQTKQEQASQGSMVMTNNGIYFLSIGIGEVNVNDQKIYCISAISPIGELIKGRRNGDTVTFRGKKITIQEIV